MIFQLLDFEKIVGATRQVNTEDSVDSVSRTLSKAA
jgi:hypothetical protein